MAYFEIGTKVKLTKQGLNRWAFGYEGDEMNPADTVGKVIGRPDGIADSLGFTDRVTWSNGNTNSYMIDDLEAVTE